MSTNPNTTHIEEQLERIRERKSRIDDITGEGFTAGDLDPIVIRTLESLSGEPEPSPEELEQLRAEKQLLEQEEQELTDQLDANDPELLVSDDAADVDPDVKQPQDLGPSL